jgi:hypothetical protein
MVVCVQSAAAERIAIVTNHGEMSASDDAASLSAARRALVDFAERSPASQADIDQVMRALVSHDDWYVPVEFAGRAWAQAEFDQMLRFGTAEPTAVLNVFTDRESAVLAEGRALGVFVGPVLGAALMRALTPDIEAIVVNPASPLEHQWYIAAGGFPIAQTWATAIAAERALANRGAGPVPSVDLLDHHYQLLIEKPTRALAQIFLPDIDGALAVCFTATDRVDEFVASLPLVARSLADLTIVNGPRLFDMMRGIDAAGLVINAGSDDQTALTREDIDDIIASAAARR